MNKPKLILFWEGPKPDRIKMCEETIFKHCSETLDILVLNFDNLWNYLNNNKTSQFIVNNPNIRIQHKSEYIRASVMYETGGFWMDSDHIVLKDISHLVHYLDKRDFSGTMSLFCCTKHSQTLKQWQTDIAKILLSENPPGNDETRYLETSYTLFSQKGWKHKNGITLEEIRPISWEPNEFIKLYDKNINPRNVITINTCAVSIWESLMPKWFMKLSREKILNSDYLISKLYRIGLGIDKNPFL